ncbi:hypothetical protein COLO4_06837 [Corchorus olitorius]|uniref:Uncharacterized protein n=1 Tax=Corchorus olitorius TaxID=93759 RepID=A0A1R3KLR9_9ROSI|nr:hypothetical protein COLO4_06837 [Corchorus olitorius]
MTMIQCQQTTSEILLTRLETQKGKKVNSLGLTDLKSVKASKTMVREFYTSVIRNEINYPEKKWNSNNLYVFMSGKELLITVENIGKLLGIEYKEATVSGSRKAIKITSNKMMYGCFTASGRTKERDAASTGDKTNQDSFVGGTEGESSDKSKTDAPEVASPAKTKQAEKEPSVVIEVSPTTKGKKKSITRTGSTPISEGSPFALSKVSEKETAKVSAKAFPPAKGKKKTFEENVVTHVEGSPTTKGKKKVTEKGVSVTATTTTQEQQSDHELLPPDAVVKIVTETAATKKRVRMKHAKVEEAPPGTTKSVKETAVRPSERLKKA